MKDIPESTREKLEQIARGTKVRGTARTILGVDGQQWLFYDEDGVTRYRLVTDDDLPF